MLKYNCFNIYFFIMKKIKALVSFWIIQYLLFIPRVSAVVSGKDVETTNENVSIITSFFSKDLFINLIFALFVIVCTFLLSKFLTLKLTWYLEKTAEWEWTNREELIWVVTRTVNISILTIWFLITLWILWIDTWILMWWIWFWLWFALKIFLTNFLAWILMVTQWHYHNWDLIKIWEKVWHIKNINALFTSVQQFDWIIFYVPNVKFMEEEVSNYNSNDKRRVDIKIWVDYDTDLLKTKEIMLRVLDNFPNILKAPNPDIFVSDFSDSSIDLNLRFWINSSDKYFEIKSNVTETINMAFKKYWIIIPFPQITLSNRSDLKIKK